MHQHNGCNSCSVCLHPGESFSQRRVYAAGFNYQDRTHEMYATKAITKGTIVNGVKGASPLTDLDNLCDGIPVDYMHCVLEGSVGEVY